jgi:pimeloyl-ACP methyl ester carboxylesterase
MTKPTTKTFLKHWRSSDIRGIVQLATQATTGVTHIVEGVHRSVLATIETPNSPTHSITGLVYKSIHGVTYLLGQGIDQVLAGLQPILESTGDTPPGTPQREMVLSALNGVMGDHLVASQNPLAIPMTLRYQGQDLNWQALSPMPEATGKLLLLIHGLCLNDRHWHTQNKEQAVDHGEVLASALNYTPLYLRYNSGLHTSQNGRDLSAQLEQMITYWPTQIEELTVVAHSMGGLLIRSAYHDAKLKALRWPDHLKNIVFLGTPHHGAPLEQAGNWVDVILESTPYTAPFARLGQVRSAGITDLRYGNVVDEDWQGRNRFHRQPDTREIVSLPEGVACYTAAATTAERRTVLADRLIGDGLVPLRSALGQHDDERRNLAFAQTSQWVGYRMNHLELLNSPKIAEQIIQWLTPIQTKN